VAIAEVAARCIQEPGGKRAYAIVTVRTESGVTGVGETAAGPDPRAAVAMILGQRKTLVGLDATALELVPRTLFARTPERRRELAPVQAAMNMALLDILGKLANAPVYELLGGPTRNKIRALACLETVAEKDLPAAVEKARQAGFRAFSVPLPPRGTMRGRAFFQQIVRYLEGLRAKAGNDTDFVLDCRGRLTPAEAQSLARALEPFHVLWLDEPVSNIDPRTYARISAETVTPLGCGRSITEKRGFLELLRSDAIDALRPDIALNGITAIRKAAALAETYYVALAPFHRGGSIATAAALHLAASIPNFFIQEIPFAHEKRDQQMRRDVVGSDLETAKDGFLALPRGPGLGIRVHDEVLKRYEVESKGASR
jgi:galactonate dehydratase